MLIEVQFLKGDKPSGRAHTYYSDALVKVGGKAQINSSAKGIVTEIDVPEEEVAASADKVKSIVGAEEDKSDKTEPVQVLCLILQSQWKSLSFIWARMLRMRSQKEARKLLKKSRDV